MTDYRIDGPFIVYPNGTRLRAISGGGDGSSKQKSTTTQTVTRAVAAPSLEEQAAQRQAAAQLAAYEQNIQALQASQAYKNALGISDSATRWLSDYAAGRTPSVDQFTMNLLNQAYEYPRQRGLKDLQTAADQAAAMRGMTRADSPIGSPYLSQVSDFGNQLASAQAKAALDLGQQRYTNMANVAPFGLNLQQQVGQGQLNLSQTANQLREGLANYRLNAAPVTTTQTGTQRGSQPFWQTFGQATQGIGSLLGGIGGVAGVANRAGYFGKQPADPYMEMMKLALGNRGGQPSQGIPGLQRAQPIAPAYVPTPPRSDLWFN